ncbi:M24 family metallopeptidase [Paucidesulfovibrio longus]|uniref:M24 family metallopeptidase n=1 Tax=Paucidesulfovibrio longus TaxID=889 RepID=UPI0003B55310|nr:M24 family metallopeptidase [Paucidesulfovibrio longus]
MSHAEYLIPESELSTRWQKCRAMLRETAPEAGGLLAFSRVNIYYLSGTLGMGVFWLPLEGEPVLFCRKGLERAGIESAVRRKVAFKSYGQLEALAAEAGSPLPETLAVETGGLTMQLGELLRAKLKGKRFVPGDMALGLARSFKSEWELGIMRRCGALHHECLHELLPTVIRPGMSEREISHRIWEVFYSRGHMGVMRMGSFGEEIFLGHVSAGESGNYSSAFNGPLGVQGEHPAIPYMGSAGNVWRMGQPLACDVGFSLEGYATDKTQVYWAGTDASIPDAVRSAHSFCMDVQAWLAESMVPGALPSQLYAGCLEMATKAGMAEGFMGIGDNQVPFVGHGIGLTIDGYPVIAKGFDRPLEVGMVLALEPKQGVPGVGMVGVENTFEVTPQGAACITGDRFEMVCVE